MQVHTQYNYIIMRENIIVMREMTWSIILLLPSLRANNYGNVSGINRHLLMIMLNAINQLYFQRSPEKPETILYVQM